MNNFPKKQLLINYLLGICTPREEEEVEVWLDKEPANVLLMQQIAKELGEKKLVSTPEKEEIREQVMRHIFQDRVSDIEKRSKNVPRFSLFPSRQLWLKIAALILVIATGGVISIYYGSQYLYETQSEVALQQRALSHGQTASLRFSDGSVIKVNGGSTLRYPERFAKDQREVYLKGEAYFSITRDELRPFIVHTDDITIRVLGTSFNIKAYESEGEIQVAVAEGMVEVFRAQPRISSDEDRETVLLEKDQWVTYRSSGQVLEKGQGDIWEMIAWKDQVLVFKDKPFDEVARMLERWYGVEIVLKNPALKKYILEGEHRDISLEEVLKSIQYVTGMDYKVDEKVVTIY